MQRVLQRVHCTGLLRTALTLQRTHTLACSTSTSTSTDVQKRIQGLVDADDVVLFMKGDRQQPQCGFSQFMVAALNLYEVQYKEYNVLQDESLREGVKVFSDWPTIPQLYVKQEFVGGCDIIQQMHKDGTLAKLWTDKNIQARTQWD